jgi:hypothetical protein
MNLTDHDRELIARAREIGPALRANKGDAERLGGWLLAELADLAERLTAGECFCGHPAASHGPGRGECARCSEGYCARREDQP